jgi:NAD(P)H-nitrite reductase large subunit
MERLACETSIDFAKRVQKAIAVGGGLVDLEVYRVLILNIGF